MTDINQAKLPSKSPRGKPFEKGNPGKPKGALNRSTTALQAMLDGQAEAIIEKVIEKGLEGDMTALRLCLNRILTVRRGRTVDIDLLPIRTIADAAVALSQITEAAGSGQISPEEAADLAGLVSATMRALESVDLENRVKRLEELEATNASRV